ncbi:MAG: hypothetical protein ACM35G_12315 [Planctomycetaceae bacterium]
MSLTSGTRLRTRVAGVFLFLPLLAQLHFDQIVAQAGYPGSEMVPASAALLALLTLKLLDKERHSHINDFNFDEALGLFAGLNILPKKSYATDYSYRTTRANQRALLEGWVSALGSVMFPAAQTFSLDFHPIPYRGDPTGLDRHYLPRRGVAGPSIQSFFALEQDSRCLCYANANLTRGDQHGELMRFVEFWHAITGSDPQWLYFDSKLIDYSEMSRVNDRGIHFITIRRRGAALLRRLEALPRAGWTTAVLDTPQRCHQRIRYIDETIKLRGYTGPIRQIAVDGLGRERPTLFLSNHFDETARNLIIRYAGRNRVEDGLGISVNFFHLDCLASEVRLNVDLDATLTVLANGCYRWLGKQLRGYEKADPKQLYRLFVETAGVIKATDQALIVCFDRRSHNPILREAALDREPTPIPWLDGRHVQFAFE